MYKTIVNLICLFIPFRSLRRKIRDKISPFDIAKAFEKTDASIEELRLQVKKDLSWQIETQRRFAATMIGMLESQLEFEHYVSIGCIIKDEATYIEEWLEYHIIKGVGKFYIYDNGSTDNIKEVLAPYIEAGIVDYLYFPGESMQINAYNHLIRRLRNNRTYWLALIDMDEFIVVRDGGDIPSFLKPFEGNLALTIGWLYYGTAGKKEREPGLVIERFRDHEQIDSDEMVRDVKLILNPRHVRGCSIHSADALSGVKRVNTHGEEAHFHSPGKSSNITMDGMYVAHYALKSLEELHLKSLKGNCTKADHQRHREKGLDSEFWSGYLKQFDRNEVKNDPIMDKYVKPVKTAIEKRRKTLKKTKK